MAEEHEIPVELVEQITDTAFEMAHEHCGDEGCSAGGWPWWKETTALILAAATEHATITPIAEQTTAQSSTGPRGHHENTTKETPNA